ncbi:flagellar basal body P-ring formation chaperone FlgA [Melaminivora sp.]
MSPVIVAAMPNPSRVRRGLSVLALACAMAGVQAQQAGAPPPGEDLGMLSQRWADAVLQQTQAGGALPLRMEVEVGALDPRLRLAPCERVEPYLPVGTRLWGRTRLGLRCVQGAARWNVFLPITVKAFGPAWVLAGNVSAGATLSEADAIESEVDWAAEPSAIIAHREAWIGQTAARTLSPGQALRQGMVRAPEMFKAGSPVRVVVQGPGYAVTSSGQAVTAGAAGQNVRIRMSNGRLISGIVAEDGTVMASL